MLTLTKGYEKPQNTDTSDVWMPAMERNIQRMNDHDHDGTDGAVLARGSYPLNPANWVATSGGMYRMAVTVPAPFSYDSCDLWFRLSTGEMAFPTVERIDASNFYVYTNDNSISFTAYYR